MKIFLIILLIAILSSCSVFEENDITHQIPVDSISINNISNLTADFTAKIYCESSCWKNTYFEKSIHGNNVFIKTFAVVDGSKTCPDVCVYAETPVSLFLPTPNSYTFHFWRSDTSSIDTTINIGI